MGSKVLFLTRTCPRGEATQPLGLNLVPAIKSNQINLSFFACVKQTPTRHKLTLAPSGSLSSPASTRPQRGQAVKGTSPSCWRKCGIRRGACSRVLLRASRAFPFPPSLCPSVARPSGLVHPFVCFLLILYIRPAFHYAPTLFYRPAGLSNQNQTNAYSNTTSLLERVMRTRRFLSPQEYEQYSPKW